MSDFEDRLDISEIERVPEDVRPFLSPLEFPGDRQTWAFYSYGFSAAFYDLLDTAIEAHPNRDYLHMPIVFMCRHSIELALKHAIVFVSRHTGVLPHVGGHNLLRLWRELSRQIAQTGFTQDDEWSRYCRDLIQYLQTVDKGADRFRYPSDLMGNPFPPEDVELETVGKVHWHVTGYCDAVVSMIDASAP